MDWRLSAAVLYNRARGMTPWPGSFTVSDGNVVKLAEIRPAELISEQAAGTVICENRRVFVVCGDGKTLEIGKIQPAGKKMMPVADFLRGNKLPERFDVE